MSEEEIINELCNQMIEKQSFDYDDFVSARQKVELNGYYVIFDAISMVVYQHNFKGDLCSLFWKDLRKSLKCKFSLENTSKEDIKSRNEYAKLAILYNICPDLFGKLHIKKCTAPDFELIDNSGKKRIGIELYELITAHEAIADKISDQSVNNTNVEEIRNNAIRTHGKKANSFIYKDLGGVMAIGTGAMDFNRNRRIYAHKLVEKYDKYREKFADYDDFYVMAYGDKYDVSSEYDVMEIIEYSKEMRSDMKGFKYIVVYENNDSNKQTYFEYFFDR